MKGSRSWLALCTLHGVASLVLWASPAPLAQALVWRSADWAQRPWTAWTSAWVHLNAPHLVGNLLALGVLAAIGWRLRPTRAATLAWALSWPLLQLSLLLWPLIGYAVGLSGVLHAGVALASTALLARRGLQRAVGTAVWAGLLLKLGWESSWGPRLAAPEAAGWDFTVATRAHAAGALAGLLCALVVEWHERQKNKP